MSREAGSATKKRKAEGELARIVKKCFVRTGATSHLSEKESFFEHTYVAQQDVEYLYNKTASGIASKIPTVQLEEIEMVTMEDYAQLFEANGDIKEKMQSLYNELGLLRKRLTDVENDNTKLKQNVQELTERVAELEDKEELTGRVTKAEDYIRALNKSTADYLNKSEGA